MMKSSSSAFKFLLAHYRAILLHASLLGLAFSNLTAQATAISDLNSLAQIEHSTDSTIEIIGNEGVAKPYDNIFQYLKLNLDHADQSIKQNLLVSGGKYTDNVFNLTASNLDLKNNLIIDTKDVAQGLNIISNSASTIKLDGSILLHSG